ncbi:DUF177 domain-containing protein [Acetobacteraceae bacterium H6797]|nr:DUF177 domain-containing protein [Acetobacteraceae bacterium H6797]
MTPELSRPLPWAAIRHRAPGEGRIERIEATPAERAALARRFGIVAVDSLNAELELRAGPGGTAIAEGRLKAVVVQECIVSLKPIEQAIDEKLRLRFLPEGAEPGDDTEFDAPDEIPTEGEAIELGEAIAESLALALDPYPRDPLAAIPEEFQAPEEDESEQDTVPDEPKRPNPFAALAALKKT